MCYPGMGSPSLKNGSIFTPCCKGGEGGEGGQGWGWDENNVLLDAGLRHSTSHFWGNRCLRQFHTRTHALQVIIVIIMVVAVVVVVFVVVVVAIAIILVMILIILTKMMMILLSTGHVFRSSLQQDVWLHCRLSKNIIIICLIILSLSAMLQSLAVVIPCRALCLIMIMMIMLMIFMMIIIWWLRLLWW